MNWDAYWYGDCVSLVMRSRYDGTAPWFYSGWCFDFAADQQITVSPAPKTATWGTELNLRLEQARTYSILGSYNEYVDVCIGQQTDSVFHPVIYLLTKDGVVEYRHRVYRAADPHRL